MPTPHRMVDSIANGLANGAQGILDSVAGTLRSAGSSLMGALDKPFEAVTGKEGPHRIVDRLANGAVGTAQNVVDQGIIGSAKEAGESIMKALDHPVEQVGLPPDLGEGSGFFSKLRKR